jgi:hypothetical protein
MVCFDTSGLLPVACAIRERVQDAIILIAGDNDLWNRRKDGSSYNPGLEAATKAAQEVGGLVAVPPFSEADQSGTDDKGRLCGPTDFNDLAAIRGAGAVVACIEEALNGTPFAAGAVVEPEPDPEISPEEAAFPGGALPPAEQPPIDGNEEDGNHLAKNKHFTVLGYDRDEYYFFVHAKQQILCRKRGDFNEMGLLELANDWASDGGCEEHEPEEITREQFMERLEPDAVQISGDGSFDFWFNDGGLTKLDYYPKRVGGDMQLNSHLLPRGTEKPPTVCGKLLLGRKDDGSDFVQRNDSDEHKDDLAALGVDFKTLTSMEDYARLLDPLAT